MRAKDMEHEGHEALRRGSSIDAFILVPGVLRVLRARYRTSTTTMHAAANDDYYCLIFYIRWAAASIDVVYTRDM